MSDLTRLTNPSPSRFFHELRSGPRGLSEREAARRLTAYGPNELLRATGRRWRRELLAQLTHPLAALLALAAVLSAATGNVALAAAIVVVIMLNAAFASRCEAPGRRRGGRPGSRAPLDPVRRCRTGTRVPSPGEHL